MYDAEILHLERLRPFITRFLLPNVFPKSYLAGQYAHVLKEDQVLVPLSMANAPGPLIEFHLYHPEHNKAAHSLLQRAYDEHKWQLDGPFGACTIDVFHQGSPIIFVVYMTGIAPAKAILEALTDHETPIQLYWLMASRHDLYLEDSIQSWAGRYNSFKVDYFFQNDFASKHEANISVLQTILQNNDRTLTKQQVYSAGPKPFVYYLYHEMIKHGMQAQQFFSDIKPIG